MSIPSPPPPPPLPSPLHSSPTSNPTPLSAKKPQALPWTEQETVHLIQAYQEKWYSLKRGQLKANQWEEVAVTVAARCGYDYTHPAKSATQCRHKMEKLRRRYREEAQRVSLGASSTWPYFNLMESLERGPSPISARPLALVPRREGNEINGEVTAADEHENNGYKEQEEDHEEEEDEEVEDYGYRSKSRSINYILRKPSIVNRFPGSDSGFWQGAAAARKRKREGVEEEEGSGEGGEFGLAEEIRMFVEKMMRVERKKMEMLKETERWRMQMEKKRMEMILDSQRKIIDMIAASSDP